MSHYAYIQYLHLYMLPPCSRSTHKSRIWGPLQTELPSPIQTHTRHFQCCESTFPTPGEGHDNKSAHTKGSISLPLSVSLSHPFFLSLTHTLSLFSSHLKRLPKDRSKKMNRSQRVSWQQRAVAHKHCLDQRGKSYNQSLNAEESPHQRHSLQKISMQRRARTKKPAA